MESGQEQMDVAGRELKIWLDFEFGSLCLPAMRKVLSGSRYGGQEVAVSGLLAASTELIARVPRTSCQEHGILQAAVPGARPGSEFTLMMEAMILLVGQQMSVSAAARHLGESDKRLWRGRNTMSWRPMRPRTGARCAV